ncbi:MAG: sulfate transporter [Prevotellaceae bacterium]|nr:sulfate transporter [Prevotella sp.]MDD7256789.1 sulfate transporter [Prevotellaceae bacterium]MDY6131023.1 sulfate transporter [Prevotella sp.]
MENIIYYAIALIVIVIGVVTLKKIASCMIKSIVMLAVVAALTYLYWFYIK